MDNVKYYCDDVPFVYNYIYIYININYCCSTNAKSHSYTLGHLNFHIREHTHSKFDSNRKLSKSRKK